MDRPYLRSRMKPVSRREVIKTFLLGAAFSNVIGNSWAASLVYEIRALSHVQTGMLQVNLADFPALADPLGSVRIGTSPLDARGERQVGIFPPVIINRGAGEDFYIFSAECTHEGCTVRRLNASGLMVCPCHGSQFAINGDVRAGPAGQPLRAFQYTRQGSMLQIQMPDTFYEVKAQKVASASRLQLSFLGFDQIVYEVYFRPTLSAAFERMNFATTPDGALTQTEIAGRDDFLSVYLDRPGAFGFFQVAMKTRTV